MSDSNPMMVKGHIGSPGQAAYNSNLQKSASQTDLINSVSKGGMKKRGGGITISPVQTMYKPTGGEGQTVGDINVNNKIASNQGAVNSANDHLATQKGGKRVKRGGNPDWLWGCYSGGKRRKTRTNKRKTKRYRKKTRSNKK